MILIKHDVPVRHTCCMLNIQQCCPKTEAFRFWSFSILAKLSSPSMSPDTCWQLRSGWWESPPASNSTTRPNLWCLRPEQSIAMAFVLNWPFYDFLSGWVYQYLFSAECGCLGTHSPGIQKTWFDANRMLSAIIWWWHHCHSVEPCVLTRTQLDTLMHAWQYALKHRGRVTLKLEIPEGSVSSTNNELLDILCCGMPGWCVTLDTLHAYQSSSLVSEKDYLISCVAGCQAGGPLLLSRPIDTGLALINAGGGNQ